MTLPLLVAAWLAGLMLGFRWEVDPLPLFLLASAALALAVLLRLLGRAWWPLLLVMALLLGMARVAAFDPHPPPLIAQDAREVSLRGRVDGDPEATGQRIKFVLAVCPTRPGRRLAGCEGTGVGLRRTSAVLRGRIGPASSLLPIRGCPAVGRGLAATPTR